MVPWIYFLRIKYNPAMAGKIPSTFINDLISRVDIVDVVDRRVPLTRKGREFMACCPFHEEKTPSFTVSPNKQFYHCFGCGAHGTAIGFLMDYANLGFVEAVEELADGVGMQVPQAEMGKPAPPPGESPDLLLKVVEQASRWFQDQLRSHPDGKQAIAYLKSRGLDGKIAAEFKIGFAPESWSSLADSLATTPILANQLVKTGLIKRKEGVGVNTESEMGQRDGTSQVGQQARFYDRFRGRVIFPIEDHRGRVVAFGGRILGDGEPKYLNSPETPLFHKGAELYGLHRARREIGAQNKSIVVEGYMDVVSLAQFGVTNAVATLGTATSRTHLQRLFRLAPEIVFCFDGDRAGRDAAWKAMQISLEEYQDGRQISFLFLGDGEDPDTTVRAEGKAAFLERVDNAVAFPDFLFDGLIEQVDMSRMDGKARLVSLAKPLISRLPEGALKDMMRAKLSSLSGLTGGQLGGDMPGPAQNNRHRGRKYKPDDPGQISPLASAISLLLQNPGFVGDIEPSLDLDALKMQGAEVLRKIISTVQQDESQTTAQLLEAFRDSSVHGYLEKLAVRQHFIDESTFQRLVDKDDLKSRLNDTLTLLIKQQSQHEREEILESLRQKSMDLGMKGLSEEEKSKLAELMSIRAEEIGRESNR